MSNRNGGNGPRTVALVGPYGSGKTSLLDAMLFAAGAIGRKGSVTAGSSVGDYSPEARARQMSIDVNCATFDYLNERFTILDCPGSIELMADTLGVLPGVDAAVVVCEPLSDK
ncbi:MAG: 50S ribosome-binding GTPase, partial [Alphaproteobacteria bacterium]|nr:50S ribosome-binding GTPase [Alphaproteobacteria bacterium]